MSNYTKSLRKLPKTFFTNILRRLNNLLRAKLIVSFAIVFIINPVSGQIDSLNISDIKFFDRFGNIHNPNDLIIPSEEDIIHHSHQCTAGFFQLTFLDVAVDTNKGFNDADTIIAQARKDLVCQVFRDLAQLIMPAVDPCTGNSSTVQIAIFSNFTSPIPMPSGALAAASSIYSSTGGNNGYVDPEVWKTTNTGSNSLANFGSLFHGFVVVNFSGITWHTDPTTLAVSPDHDMYSVLIHESIHALGFASLIDSLGNSVLSGTNFYSRYDKFLRVNGGNFLTFSQDGCYDVVFNATAADLKSGCQNIVFDDGGQFLPGTQPVYAPNPFEPGSSLSHYETNCSGNPIPDYVMHPFIGTGVNNRVPAPEEVQTLCALGYQTTGIFGDQTLSFHTTTLPACGTIVAGTNDFGPGCTLQQYSVNLCDGDSIEICNFLSNDVNAVNYSCLEIIEGGGTISNQIGNCFTYMPTSVGHKVICYIPIGTGGEEGNKTCIFINIYPCCINTDPCNLICNPNFNDTCFSNTPFNSIHSQPIPGWLCSHGSPHFSCPGTNNPPDDGYIQIWAKGNSGVCGISGQRGEGILQEGLNIIAGQNYIFSYYRQMVPGTGAFGTDHLDSIFVVLTQADNDNIPFGCAVVGGGCIPDIPPISQVIIKESNVIDTNWRQVVVCFTADDNYDALWIFPKQNTGTLAANLQIDRVELIEDNFDAGPDTSFTCGGDSVLLAAPNCRVDNMVFEWHALGNPSPISDPDNDGVVLAPPGIYELHRHINADSIVGNCDAVDTVFAEKLSQCCPIIQLNKTTNKNIYCGAEDVIYTVTITNFSPFSIVNYPISEIFDPNFIITSTDPSPLPTTVSLPEGETLKISVTGHYLQAGSYVNCIQFFDTICVDTLTACATVIIDPSPISISANISNVTCLDGDDGSIDLTISGGAPPYTFSWSNSANTEDIDSLTGGIYSVIVTDSNGCSAMDTFFIIEPIVASPTDPAPILQALNVSVVAAASCDGTCGGSVTANVTGGTIPYTYLWDDPASQTTQTATGLCAGIYSVTVIDSNGCTATTTVSVDTFKLIIIFSSNDASCEDICDGSATVTPTNGISPYTYQWDDPFFQTTATATGLCAGLYNVSVTDADSCITTTSVMVNAPLSCDGNVAIFPFGVIDSLSPCGFQIISSPCPGFDFFYLVRFTNTGCSDAYQIGTILEIQLDPTITYASTIINTCGLPLVNTNPLQWEITDTTQLTPGNECNILIKVDVISIPVGGWVTDASIIAICADSSTSVFTSIFEQPDVCSCDPNNKLLVSPDGCGELGFISNQELTYSIFFQNLGSGPAHNVIIVDTLDSDLEINSLQIMASSHTITNIQVLNNVLIVTYDSIELPPLINDTAGSIGFLIYKITPFQGLPDGTIIENSAAIIFDSLSPVITNTVINTIVDEPVPIVDAGIDQIIYLGNTPECAELTASTTGGLPPYSFVWSNGETTQAITVCPDETTTYTVTVTDANGCSSSDEVTVNVIEVTCGNNLNKVLVCHIPPGNPGNPQTICISPNAVPAHITQHGDYLGPCVDSSFTDSSGFKVGSSESLLKIYPNPFRNSTTIEYYLPEEAQNVEIVMYDIISNRKLRKHNLTQHGYGKLIIEEPDLNAGMYILRLYVNERPVSVKKVFIIE